MKGYKLYHAHGTDRAHGFKLEQKSRGVTAGNLIWIPKHLVTITESIQHGVGKWTECVVQIPDWLAEAKKLTPMP